MGSIGMVTFLLQAEALAKQDAALNCKQEENAANGRTEDTSHDIRSPQHLRNIIGELAEHQQKRHKFTKILTETQIDFISRSPFCLIATVGGTGTPCISPKGDAPGFVQVLDPGRLIFPERAGNKLIFTLLNVLRHPQVQIIFMIPNTNETLRVSGRASLSQDPTACARLAAGGQD